MACSVCSVASPRPCTNRWRGGEARAPVGLEATQLGAQHARKEPVVAKRRVASVERHEHDDERDRARASQRNPWSSTASHDGAERCSSTDVSSRTRALRGKLRQESSDTYSDTNRSSPANCSTSGRCPFCSRSDRAARCSPAAQPSAAHQREHFFGVSSRPAWRRSAAPPTWSSQVAPLAARASCPRRAGARPAAPSRFGPRARAASRAGGLVQLRSAPPAAGAFSTCTSRGRGHRTLPGTQGRREALEGDAAASGPLGGQSLEDFPPIGSWRRAQGRRRKGACRLLSASSNVTHANGRLSRSAHSETSVVLP